MAEEVKVVDTSNKKAHGQNKCPNCGSSDITHNIKKGKLVCNYCNTEFDPKEVEGIEKEAKNLEGETRASGTKDIKKDAEDVITLKCGGCGAEVVINTKEANNARCHWCRSILSINSQIDNGAVPDVVLPFRLTKEQAEDNIRKFVDKRQFFANGQFKREFTTKNIMGVYFPYMLVDAKGHGVFSGEGEHELRSYTITHGSGDNKREETVYDVEVSKLEREFDISIDDLTIESSSDKLNKKQKDRTNNVINAIMPFDTQNCIQYEANYLAGFTSEKRDVNISNLEAKVDNELKDVARIALNREIKHYDRGVRWDREDLKITGKQWVSAYLPVWLYSYQDQKKILHYVAVNARTGETMGSIPMNKAKLWLLSLLFLIIPLIAAVIITYAMEITNMGVVIGFGILGLIAMLIFFGVKNAKYSNKGARHSYEKETRHELSNVKAKDEYERTRREVSSSSMLGANNRSIKGEYIEVKKDE